MTGRGRRGQADRDADDSPRATANGVQREQSALAGVAPTTERGARVVPENAAAAAGCQTAPSPPRA